MKSIGKGQESATFLQRVFFNVAVQFFACCSAAFGKNDVCTAEKANVAVQLLLRNVPKIAAQLQFSLVACCRVGFRGVGFRTC